MKVGYDMRLNFADTAEPKDDGFELLPNGKYHCQITSMEMTETTGGKAPGTPMVKCEYTVVGGEKYENRKIWDNLVLSDESLWKTKSLLKALGVSEEEYKSDDFDFEPEAYIEMELDVRVGKQPAKGDYEARNKVTGYAPHMTTDADLIP